MLVFIVPLQSRAISRDWTRVSQLAERTLRSICAQIGQSFRVVLVCNERPQMCFTHSAVTIIEEDFPIPGEKREERMVDKSRKILRGFVHARTWAPFHVMLVDADDCVSRRLAGFVAQHADYPGWYCEQGYVHDQGSQWILRKKRFHLFCGSSHILRCSAEDLPSTVDAPASDYWILSHGHPEIVEFMKEKKTPLAPLPFIGTVYNTATGENYAGSTLNNWFSRRMILQKFLHFRPLTKKIRREFGLTELR